MYLVLGETFYHGFAHLLLGLDSDTAVLSVSSVQFYFLWFLIVLFLLWLGFSRIDYPFVAVSIKVLIDNFRLPASC